VTIRSAGPEDLPIIAAIQAASPEASQWKPEDYLNHNCLMADQAAFIVTRQVAPGEHEILNLAVAPSARRAGLARALLMHVLQRSPGSWFLEVRGSNHAAIRLYESTGFRSSGIRHNYYSSSPESAIVMHFQK
jgi:[ribosomal protein S18]-alanine N-acetyltransferase